MCVCGTGRVRGRVPLPFLSLKSEDGWTQVVVKSRQFDPQTQPGPVCLSCMYSLKKQEKKYKKKRKKINKYNEK